MFGTLLPLLHALLLAMCVDVNVNNRGGWSAVSEAFWKNVERSDVASARRRFDQPFCPRAEYFDSRTVIAPCIDGHDSPPHTLYPTRHRSRQGFEEE
ncbi:hypothetical protein IG631_18647 [Alternaria alternata]|nr:hypothetical protein IG631_18647 [Alternaria alternata]